MSWAQLKVKVDPSVLSPHWSDLLENICSGQIRAKAQPTSALAASRLHPGKQIYVPAADVASTCTPEMSAHSPDVIDREIPPRRISACTLPFNIQHVLPEVQNPLQGSQIWVVPATVSTITPRTKHPGSFVKHAEDQPRPGGV